jgi:uncharacterized membrane protein
VPRAQPYRRPRLSGRRDIASAHREANIQVLVAAAPAFFAALVEFVEALTIVLAVGVTRQWRSTLVGVGAATAALVLIVGIFGSAIVLFVPIDVLRLVVGAFLLVFGLQWLCKAVLRAAGAKAKHDEAAIYQRELAQLTEEPPVPASGMDWISFTVAFKGVLLEGLEVAFIVVTFGASAGQLGPAILGATVAGVLVLVVGALVHRPLARVPENGLKYAVGLMLVTFGTFWAGEGIGIDWPASDAILLVLLAAYLVASLAAVWAVRGTLTGRRTPATNPVAD